MKLVVCKRFLRQNSMVKN